jgi:hypothetical protein
MLVDRAIQVVPLRLDLDVRLIHTPRGAHRLGEPISALLKFRHAPRDPAKNSTVRHLHAALGHHLHKVPVGQPIRDIPPHAQLDNAGIKGALAVDGVTGDRLRNSTPRKMVRAFYRLPCNAPEPLRCE